MSVNWYGEPLVPSPASARKNEPPVMRKSCAEKAGRVVAICVHFPFWSVKLATLTASVAMIVPPAASVSPPFVALMAALIATLLSAASDSVVAVDQLIG